MTVEELDAIIRFHKAGLFQYRFLMSTTAIHLEEQTIKALEEYKKILHERR